MTRFWKYQGTGNDFILIDNRDGRSEMSSKFTLRICDRHFGIGADGVAYIVNADDADIGMRSMNSDGSVSEVCGTGLRCVAKHVYDNGIVKGEEFTIRSLHGIHEVKITAEDGKAELVEVNMGVPVLDCSEIPMVGEGTFINQIIEVEGERLLGNALSMGNPHLVIFGGLTETEKDRFGPILERIPLFPKRANVGFASVADGKIFLRVYERGAGWTLSCGTGACAAAVAAAVNDLVPYDTPIDVKLPGGWLKVTVAKDMGKVTVTGPAVLVYEGDISGGQIGK